MGGLPSDLKLTMHAKQRLEERKDPEDYYNTKNLMRSSCVWYGIDDLIPESSLYVHARYVCRKAKNKMRYMTDGNIEVLYDKNAGVAITIMEVKEKFLPITQYIKPSVLRQIQTKKENKKMKKKNIGICPDCRKKEVQLTSQGICAQCRTRKTNAKSNGKEYIPYIKLSEHERAKIDAIHETCELRKALKAKEEMKQTEEIVKKAVEPVSVTTNKVVSQLSNVDVTNVVRILKECGCEISEEKLSNVLKVLVTTDQLKDMLMLITENENQDIMLDIEQMLNVAERKLQHNWEYNGFQEEDDLKFKGFLTVRRVLKSAIYFWKRLYSTNTLVELQRAWSAYLGDPSEKEKMAGDRTSSAIRRYQISTETISTIFNTKKPFTRIFYATSEEEARKLFTQWLSERQLHENKSKTTVIELTSRNSIDGRKDDSDDE